MGGRGGGGGGQNVPKGTSDSTYIPSLPGVCRVKRIKDLKQDFKFTNTTPKECV